MYENIIWVSVVQALASSIFFSILAILGLYIVFRQIKAENFSGADFSIALASAAVKIKISVGAVIFLTSMVMIVITMVSHWWIVVGPVVIFGLSGKAALNSIKSDG